ncbi:MAG: site-2 protease family protein [Christensenellales bacterium]|jgi:stage IV sporulation protein FB
MRFTLFGAPVHISFLLLLLIPAAVLWSGKDMLSPIAAVVVHECGHIFAARYMKEPLAELDVYPFGAAIRMARPLTDRTTEFFIALTGPAASLLAATVAAGVMHFVPQAEFLSAFAASSLFLCAINLIPALPLDGGRMLKATLSIVFSERTAMRIACGLGIICALILGAAGLVGWPDVSITLIVMAVFLLIGAFSARRELSPPMTAVVLRGNALAQRGSMRLFPVAVVADLPVRAAISRLRGASLVAVVDRSFRYMGTLTEGDLLQGMIEWGPGVTLGELLMLIRK